MVLIIVTGIPATGKSTVAKELSTIFNYEYLSKDEFSLMLFNRFGFHSHEEKISLVSKADTMLFSKVAEYVNANKNVIVDKYFKSFDPIADCINEKHCHVIIAALYAKSTVIIQRFNKRNESGERPTPLFIENQYPYIEGVTQFLPPMTKDDVEKLIKQEPYPPEKAIFKKFDTSEIETKHNEILSEIVDFINENISSK